VRLYEDSQKDRQTAGRASWSANVSEVNPAERTLLSVTLSSRDFNPMLNAASVCVQNRTHPSVYSRYRSLLTL